MADVFLSCAEQDREIADRIVAALAANGIDVAPAHPPQLPPGVKQVARQLTAAKCVIVLWSAHSVRDELILAEADYARSREALVSAVIGKPPLPLGFRDVWFATLTHWRGEPDNGDFLVLKRLVEARLNPPITEHGAKPVTQPPATGREVPTIFLCYRRDDTQDAAGRLHDRLVDAYGSESVFMDIDSVPPGTDFVDHITEQIGKCSAVIVMIGKQWHRVRDKKRRRRLDTLTIWFGRKSGPPCSRKFRSFQ